MAQNGTNTGTTSTAESEVVKSFPQIDHSNIFLAAIELEIAQVKSGELAESVVRMVMKGRQIQLNFMAEQLKYARMVKGKGFSAPPLLIESKATEAK